MVLNKAYERSKIRASHIWKYATHGRDLDEFGLQTDDVSSPRNGLLLAESIEMAFAHKQVCFYYDPFRKKLCVKVLDPSLLDQLVSPSISIFFKDIDGAVLRTPDDNHHIPFRRLLNFHAKLAFAEAVTRKWINSTEAQLEDFFHLSDAGSLAALETFELDSIL